MARDEQGPDVVILSNKKVAGGIELLAAEDFDAQLYEQQFTSESEPSDVSGNEPVFDAKPDYEHNAATLLNQQNTRQRQKPAVTAIYGEGMEQLKPAEPLWTNDATLERMQTEIQSLRRLLEQQMSGLAWGQIGRSHPLWAGLLRRFGQLGLSPIVAKSLVEQIPRDMDFDKAWRMSLAQLSYQIKTVEDNILTPGKAIAFIGSSGVGKTTTIAKLATQITMSSDSHELILATTDSYRVGGREHLKSYARILGIPVRTIHNQQELLALIEQFYGDKTILIDTAGLSPLDDKHRDQTAMLGAASDKLRICSVYSAGALPPTAANAVASHSHHSGKDFSVITKLDEASSLGALISYLIEHQIPVAWTSQGQKVPDDLQQAEAYKLVTAAVSSLTKQKAESAGDETLENLYGTYAVNQPFGE